jgi:hypothetical protein
MQTMGMVVLGLLPTHGCLHAASCAVGPLLASCGMQTQKPSGSRCNMQLRCKACRVDEQVAVAAAAKQTRRLLGFTAAQEGILYALDALAQFHGESAHAQAGAVVVKDAADGCFHQSYACLRCA